MQRHWREVAPPLNISIAAQVGFKPKPPRDETDDIPGPDDEVAGDEMIAALRAMGVMG